MRLSNWLIPAVFISSSCASVPTPAPTVSGGCAAGIEYQGRTLDVGATWKLLGINVGTEVKAVREVSDLVQLYMNEAASLCDLHASGKLTAVEYADRRARLTERLAALVTLNRQMPAQQVSQGELPFFSETLHALRPGAPASTSLRVAVVKGGVPVQNGAAMKSGEGFRIAAEVPSASYFYVVLVDSSGSVSRLYPASLTGTENPVQGRVEIPRLGEREFVLDDRPGTERILVFAQAVRSNAIESMLDEIGSGGKAPADVLGVLTRGVKVRESISTVAAGASSSVVSAFGQAGYEFVIEHR
ncbi:MAG: DUF4384 domain-containing protein [Verrucomicrobia bacterium]|nr:DUF4384 domain-containing protein [Verrucomicrobiota bacterium]